MTYYGPKDLAASFRQVRGNTIQIAEDVPEQQYGFRPAPDCRGIGQTLVHIAFIPAVQFHIHSNRIDDLKHVDFLALIQPLAAEEAATRTKTEILALLRSKGDDFASYLEGLTDAFLAEQVRMPAGAQPASKSRFEMLLGVKEHEMHHRAQLMLVERLLGIVPHLTRARQQR